MKSSLQFFLRNPGCRRTLKKLAAALLALLLCPLPAGARAEEKAAVTLLVYMTGSDLETKGQAASKDITEMVDSLPAGSGIRILLQAGGSASWELDIDPSRSTRIEISGGQWHKIEENDNLNMAEADTLKDFLQWGFAYAPADRYALILWNHGAGPLLGVCMDEQYKAADSGLNTLSLKDLDEALAGSPFRDRKLMFIGFDACLMCTLEVAAQVSPYADYMIASQETEPASGWDYSFLKEMTGQEDGRTWGERIVAAYGASQAETVNTATLSCLDLGKTGSVLAELDAFFSGLTEQITPETYPAYTRCRADTKAFGTQTTSAFDLVDLTDLVLRYEKKELADGTALRGALAEMIVCFCAENTDHTNGLSIYYPFENKARYIASWSSAYQQSSFSPAYRAFVSRISEFYLRDSLFSMTSEYITDIQDEAGSVKVSIPLKAEDAALIVRSRMLVLEKLGKDAFRFVYYNDQDVKSTDSGVSCRYEGEGLFIVNREGEILQGPLSYFQVENGVAVYGFLFFGETQYPARVVYRKNADGQLVLSEILTAQGEKPDWVFLPSGLDPEKSTEMIILSFGPTGPGENTLTSLNYSAFYPEFTYRLDLNDPDTRLALVPGWSRYDRYAYLRLTDVQGNDTCSTPAVLPSYAHLTITQPREAETGAGLSAALADGTLVTGNDAGLMFVVKARNLTEGILKVQVSGMALNGEIRLEPYQFQSFAYALAPDEEDDITLFIPLKTLQFLPLPDEITEAAVTLTVTDSLEAAQEFTLSFPLTMDTAMIH